MNLDGLRQLRIVEREERKLLQLSRKIEKPQAADAQRRSDVQVVQVQSLRRELGGADPVEIHVAHYDDERREFRQELRAALHVAREKQEKRQREMEKEQGHRHIAPR